MELERSSPTEPGRSVPTSLDRSSPWGCSEHPGRVQPPAAGARGQGAWPDGPGAVPGRTVPAGGLCLALALPKGLVPWGSPASPPQLSCSCS